MSSQKDSLNFFSKGHIICSDDFTSSTLRLFTVTESFLKSVLAGDSLYFKGIDDDDVVLCTKEKTYSLKNVENSNTLLVCENVANLTGQSTESMNVPNVTLTSDMKTTTISTLAVGIVGGSLELNEINPRVFRLRQLLEADFITSKNYDEICSSDFHSSSYTETPTKSRSSDFLPELDLSTVSSDNQNATPRKRHIEETSCDKKKYGLSVPRSYPGYSFAELLELVQCSEKELEIALKSLNSVLIQGRYFLLEDDFEYSLLEAVLGAQTASDRGVECPISALKGELDHIPGVLVEYIICRYSKSKVNMNEAPLEVNELDVSLIARRVGLRVLQDLSVSPSGQRGVSGFVYLPPTASTTKPSSVTGVSTQRAAAPTARKATVLPYFSGVRVAALQLLHEWMDRVRSIWPPLFPSYNLTIKALLSQNSEMAQIMVDEDTTPLDFAVAFAGTPCFEVFKDCCIVDVPDSVTASGTEPSNSGITVRYFPESRLHHDPAFRFQQLCNEKPNWTEKELTPFLQPLAGADGKVSDLIVKFTRVVVMPNGEKYFSIR